MNFSRHAVPVRQDLKPLFWLKFHSSAAAIDVIFAVAAYAAAGASAARFLEAN